MNTSDVGLSETHKNSESSSLDSTRYTLYHGNGYGEYNGTMKLNMNKLKLLRTRGNLVYFLQKFI